MTTGSSATAKAIDAAREFGAFMSKYIGGSVEQAMGIFEDKLKYLRWERQVRLIQRAQQFLKAQGLDQPNRRIPLKIAIPLLEAGSLEENDDLQDLWATMLVNASDKESAIDIQPSFIQILQQFTPFDALIFDQMYNSAGKDNVTVLDLLVQNQELRVHESRIEIPSDQHKFRLTVENLLRLGCLVKVPPLAGASSLNYLRTTALGLALHNACTLQR